MRSTQPVERSAAGVVEKRRPVRAGWGDQLDRCPVEVLDHQPGGGLRVGRLDSREDGAVGIGGGAQVAGQLAGLWQALPHALGAASDWLDRTPFSSVLSGTWQSIKDGGVPWLRVAGVAGVATNALLDAVMILALGLYVAADPGSYFAGALRLAPAA